jgi:hypothetical protein
MGARAGVGRAAGGRARRGAAVPRFVSATSPTWQLPRLARRLPGSSAAAVELRQPAR